MVGIIDILEETNPDLLSKYEFISQTKSGAKIFSHTDPKANESIERKTTDYLCGHVFRTASEMKPQFLQYNGFIHIALEPKEEQFFEVLGIGIKGFIEKLSFKKSVTIMISGFTKFRSVLDNPTGRFLFGDGMSTNPESYGLKKPQIDKIDNMMLKEFGQSFKSINSLFQSSKEKAEIGRSYLCYDNKVINLIFVRLAVDENVAISSNSSVQTDNTGSILRKAVKEITPDVLISFGAGKDGIESYNIETISYGMILKGAVYSNNDPYISNDDLVNIYREQLKK